MDRYDRLILDYEEGIYIDLLNLWNFIGGPEGGDLEEGIQRLLDIYIENRDEINSIIDECTEDCNDDMIDPIERAIDINEALISLMIP